MRPTELYMENFMSYEKCHINLRDMDIIVIVGQNGAGKSTILQAITYALWGQVRTTSHNDVVRRGSSKCLVRLDFVANDIEYTITRERDLSGRGSTNLTFAQVDKLIGKEYTTIYTRPTIKETQEEIDKVVGSYNIFANSVLLQQGEASRFSDAPPAERKRLIGELIGLEELQEIEKKARARLAQVDTEHKNVAAILGNIDEELDGLEGVEVTLKVNLKLQETLYDKIGDVNKSLADARERLANIKSMRSLLEKLEEKLDLLQKNKNSYDIMLGKKKAEIMRLTDIIVRAEEVQLCLRQLSNLEDELECLEAARDGKKLQDELMALATKVEQLRKEADHLTLELDIDKEMLAEIDKRIEFSVSKYNDTENSISIGKGICMGYARLKAMVAGSGDYECPICLQHISKPQIVADHIQSMIDETKEKSEGLVADQVREKNKLQRAKNERDDLAMEMDSIARKLNEVRGQLHATEEEYSTRETTISLEDPIEFDEERYQKVQAEIEQLQSLRDEMVRIKHARDQIEIADADYDDLVSLDSMATLEAQKTYKEIKDLDLSISALEPDTIEDGVSVLENRLAGLEANLTTAIEKVARARADIDRQAVLEKKYEDLENKMVDLDDKLEWLDLLVQATSKTGAQALLIEAALPEIEKYANEYLADLSPNMSLRFNSQKVTAKGKVSETLDINVMVDGEEAPIETLSGGERFRADLSIRLAIGTLLAKRSGTKADMLAIDEGFGSQDSDGLEQIVLTIRSLAHMFPLILMITHVDRIAKDFDNTITISKERGRSILTLSQRPSLLRSA